MSAEVDKLKKKCPSDWDVLPFSDAVKDVTAGNPKVKQGVYQKNGLLAVIDQGQDLIGGYIDDETQACKEKLPCILFGDHTKTFKFIEQPFVLGADGVKILAPIGEFDKRFLYHYLNTLKLPDDVGYSRHYKFLKEKCVVKPPLAEQKRLAAILDKADTIRRKRQQAIKLADDFLRATFLDMFGDPVTNPKGWDVKKFSQIGTLDRGVSKNRPRNAPELLGGPYPLIQTGDVANSNGYIRSYKSTYSEVGLKQSKMWSTGTLCITIAANIAKTGILTFDACFPDSVVGFVPNTLSTTEYVQYWLSFLQKILEDSAPESAQKNINLEILRNLDIPLPPINHQNEFSKHVAKVQALKLKQTTGSDNSSILFNSITQRAFRGEL